MLPAPRLDEAEHSLREAFDLAVTQNARSWQLRAAMDLGSLSDNGVIAWKQLLKKGVRSIHRGALKQLTCRTAAAMLITWDGSVWITCRSI